MEIQLLRMTLFCLEKSSRPKTGSEFAYIMSDIKNADQVNAGKSRLRI